MLLWASCGDEENDKVDPCTSTNYDVEVNVIEFPDQNADNGQIEVSVTNPGTNALSYSLNDTLYQSLNSFSDLGGGDYRIYVRDEVECTSSEAFFLEENPLFVLTVENGTGSGTYSSGSEVAIVADDPELAFDFSEWTGDTDAVASIFEANTSIIMPSGDITVRANYEAILYSLTVNEGTSSGEYAFETVVNITADEPPEGEVFTGWIGDTIYLTNAQEASTTLSMPAEDVQITATYAQIVYELTVTNGTGSGMYPEGEKVEISATPSSIEEFEAWTGAIDLIDDPTLASAIITMPAADIELFATFSVRSVSFSREVMPIIQSECRISSCHLGFGSDADFSTYEGILPEIAPIRTTVLDCTMPISGCLPQEQIDLIVAWIDAGAPNN